MRENNKVIIKTVKKSEINASGILSYKMIQYPQVGFIPCEIEEEKETLQVTYQVDDLFPFEQIRGYAKQDKLRLLLDVAQLEVLMAKYKFSLCPDNLYFDRNFKVYVLERDIRNGEETDFVEQYCALIGFTLQKKYSYTDYREGGMTLLKKNRFLKPICEMKEKEQITDYLVENYETVTADIKENKMLVNKRAYISSRFYLITLIILLLASCSYIGYYSLIEKPQMTAKLKAEVDYLKGDYISVIDDLTALEMKELGYDQKFILSRSFVNAESLTVEQKENILKDLPVNGDEKLMEYWIYIGRLNPVEAQNIAMQKSDDELLLYAYMMEKDLTETNTEMTGEEKAAKLKELEENIAKLAQKYLPEEE